MKEDASRFIQCIAMFEEKNFKKREVPNNVTYEIGLQVLDQYIQELYRYLTLLGNINVFRRYVV